jgi:hypothetical protein
VQENIAAVMQGAQLKAHEQQDHLSHIHEHLRFITDPMQGANPVFGGQQLQVVLRHCMEHLMMLYDVSSHVMAQAMAAMMGVQAPPDTLVAAAADKAAQTNQQNLAPLLQMFQQAGQIIQQRMPPQPMDPSQVTLQAAMAETERRKADDGQKHAVAMGKLELEGKKLAEGLRQQAEALQKTVGLEIGKQQQAMTIEMEKLRQGWQDLQLQAEKQAAERDARLHDMLSALAEKSVQGSEIPQQPVAPEMPDLTPHIDRIERLMAQQQQGQQGQQGEALTAALQGISQLLQQTSRRPNKILRDANGEAVGMIHDPSMELQ